MCLFALLTSMGSAGASESRQIYALVPWCMHARSANLFDCFFRSNFNVDFTPHYGRNYLKMFYATQTSTADLQLF